MRQCFQAPSTSSASKHPVSCPIHQFSPHVTYLAFVLHVPALLHVTLQYLSGLFCCSHKGCCQISIFISFQCMKLYTLHIDTPKNDCSELILDFFTSPSEQEFELWNGGASRMATIFVCSVIWTADCICPCNFRMGEKRWWIKLWDGRRYTLSGRSMASNGCLLNFSLYLCSVVRVRIKWKVIHETSRSIFSDCLKGEESGIWRNL